MKVLSHTAVGKAHGKIILVGEHAVVHNEPAIAIPFTSATVEVTVERTLGLSTMDSIYHCGKLTEAPSKIKNLVTTFKAVCDYFNLKDESFHINITSNIPAERGMGSSAAVATALVRALFNYFDTDLNEELLFRFVSISEKIAHGNPSGLDAKVVSSDVAIYFVKGEDTEPFEMDLPAYLVVADTGDEGDTLSAVATVGKLLNDQTTNGQQLVHELGDLTDESRKLIETKNVKQLGAILDKAQERLRELMVSNDKLDTLVKAAKQHGALGAKLTGGGRGGCMITLVEKAEQAYEMAEHLMQAGATETWIHSLGVKEQEELLLD